MRLNVTHTYEPDGTKITYSNGMERRALKDLTYQMKAAVRKATQQKVKSVKQPKLKVA